MTYLWPEFLWLLAAVPLLPVVYAWLLRRRARSAVRFSSLGVVRAAVEGRGWRRHVPPALLLLACSTLLFAASRPVARVPLPWTRTTIMLAMDVSLSMRVNDVQPSRLAAAQEAAKLFLRDLPRDVEVGLVTFAGSTEVAQRATLDRASLVTAIDAFQMQTGTAVGSAIVQCLAELFPDDRIEVDALSVEGRHRGRSVDGKARPAPKQITPVKPGSYASAAIILLSDGRRTTGIETLEAARMAASRGVRVHVVGLGTPGGTVGMGEYASVYMQLDEPTLREVARMTGGDYHHAGSADQLRNVYGKLGSRLQVRPRETELSALLAALAALVAVLGAGLSVTWFGRSA